MFTRTNCSVLRDTPLTTTPLMDAADWGPSLEHKFVSPPAAKWSLTAMPLAAALANEPTKVVAPTTHCKVYLYLPVLELYGPRVKVAGTGK